VRVGAAPCRQIRAARILRALTSCACRAAVRFASRSLRWTARVDLREESPARTSWPSGEGGALQLASTRTRMTTTASG